MITMHYPLRHFERLSRQVWRDPWTRSGTLGSALWCSGAATSMPMEVRRFEDRVEAGFDLPGVDPDSIEVTVERDTLTVKAERPRPEPDEAAMIVLDQRQYGTVTRQFWLGQALDSAKVEAHYDRGVLVVTIPVAENAKAQRIQVGVTAG